MSKRKLLIKHDCYFVESMGARHIKFAWGLRGIGIYKELLDYMAIHKTDTLRPCDLYLYCGMLGIQMGELKEFLDYCSANPDDGLFSKDGVGYTSLELKEQIAHLNKNKEYFTELANRRWSKEKQHAAGRETIEPLEVKGCLYITRKAKP